MQKWKYMFITCHQKEGGDWLPHYINGNEVPNWFAGTAIYQTSNELGEKGWELVGFSFSTSDTMRLIFKRPE
jgi:hypothetical protein